MRVLILTQFYAPEVRTAPSNLAALAEALQLGGDEVMVLTGFPSHPFGQIYDGYRLRWRQWETLRGVRVLRVPIFPDHSSSHLRRTLNYASFALSATLVGSWLTRSFAADVILAYLPPPTNALPLGVLRRLHWAGVVVWMSDVWPDALVAAGARLSSPTQRLVSLLARAAYRQADLLCVNSAITRSHLVERGLPDGRVTIVSDWADERVYYPAEPRADLARRHGLAGRFNVMYAGNLGPAQELDVALSAAKLLEDLPEIQLVFVGDGQDKPRLERLRAAGGLDNVRFIERQPASEMPHLFALADALLLHLRAHPLFEQQIPSKSMAYLACARPVVAAISGETETLIEEAEAGVCCPPGNPEALARAIRFLRGLTPAERARLGANARSLYLERFTASTQIERLRSILSAAARTPRARDAGIDR